MTGDPQEPVTDARPSCSAGQRLLGESIQVNWAPAFKGCFYGRLERRGAGRRGGSLATAETCSVHFSRFLWCSPAVQSCQRPPGTRGGSEGHGRCRAGVTTNDTQPPCGADTAPAVPRPGSPNTLPTMLRLKSLFAGSLLV